MLVERVESLCAAGWREVRVVTDHGWLWLPGGPPKVDLAKYLTRRAVRFYAEVTLSYDAAIAQEKNGRPFAIEGLRAIQLSKADVLDTLLRGRNELTCGEWKRLLLRSIGLEPAALSERAQMIALIRMAPFVERNYNLVELGPRGTGKSHLFQQISPYAHLISGGRATVAKLFVNNANGQRGLVCQYDVVCFDESPAFPSTRRTA